MAPHQLTPWHDYRAIAEQVGQAVAEAIGNTTGAHVELGIGSACDPEEMISGRPMPMHVTVVRFHRPLRDVMIFVSSLKDEVTRPLVELAARTAMSTIDVPTGIDDHGSLGTYDIEDAIRFDDLDEALEQCDALYLEAVYSLELPTGELQMVLGTGLLESATFLRRGESDPFAEGASFQPADADDATPVAVVDVSSEPPSVAVEDEQFAAEPAASAIDALDAVLADADLAAPIAAPVPAAPANPLANVSATRWTDLLSGVDVELSAELGRADLALGDITALDGDSVLTLDQLVHEPVTVYVNGTAYATARLVVVDGEYGIEILEVLDQASLVSSLAA